MAMIIGCLVAPMYFSYLRVSIGVNMGHTEN